MNTTGVENIIEAINSYGKLSRVLFGSSMLVCKRGYVPKDYQDYMPTTLYGRSKASGEEIIKNYKNISAEWVIIRPTSIWGPWFDEPYRNFFDIVTNGRYAHPGRRPCTKTFGYVKNAIYQIDKLLFSDNPDINHKVFYLGDYTPIDISEWADQIAAALGRKPLRHGPLFIFKIAALIGDGLRRTGFSKFPMNSFRLKNMTEDNIIDLSDIRSVIPSLPYSRQTGIEETLAWMRRVK